MCGNCTISKDIRKISISYSHQFFVFKIGGIFPDGVSNSPLIVIGINYKNLIIHFRSNLTRLWVLRVCQQSEKHTEKILNVDEFVRRIFMVIHSNDPTARALTLRTLGAVAGVIPEKHQVHHAIRRALDSHDVVEVEAAIAASVMFAEKSKYTHLNIPFECHLMRFAN